MILDPITETTALLKEFDERIKRLEKFFPTVEVPKSKRNKRSEDVKRYRKQLLNSYK